MHLPTGIDQSVIVNVFYVIFITSRTVDNKIVLLNDDNIFQEK